MLLSFFLGLFSAFLILAWTTRIQLFSRRFDDLCDVVQSGAELGVNYWVSDATVAKHDIRVMEIQIIGCQHLISDALDALGKRLNESDRRVWSSSQAPFFGALTGGDFMEDCRNVDYDRARLIQSEMANLVKTIREYQDTSLKLRRFFAIVMRQV